MADINKVIHKQPRELRRNDRQLTDYDDVELGKRYRSSSTNTDRLTRLVQHRLQRPTHRNRPLTPRQQVMIALRFYVSGNFLHVILDTFGDDLPTVLRTENFEALNNVQCSQKKGVAHWADNYICEDFKVLNNMSWWYDWRIDTNYFHTHHICSTTIDQYRNTYVPMVWSYYRNAHINVPDQAQFILGFNEPNHGDQANLSPKQAAAAWVDLELNSKGKPLVSPSAAACGGNCNHGDTVQWFNEFFQHCNNCRVDYLATHAYYCDPHHTMHFLRDLYHRYGRKIWLTEFACANTADPVKTLNFMKQILPRLESADYVFRYSWYMARIKTGGKFLNSAASLLEPNASALTPLGRFYNDFQGPVNVIVG